MIAGLLSVSSTYAQSKFLFTNAQKIDLDRYKGIDGSPYLFDEWPMATIYDNAGLDYVDVEINFNGATNEIEIRKDDKFIELEKSQYKSIEIKAEDKKILFQRDFQGHFKTDFIQVIHEGKLISLVRRFESKMEEVELQNVGKTERIKRFNKRFSFIFLKDGKPTKVKSKKKQLISYLGKKKQLDSFIDSSKLKKNRLNHLQEIMEYYETL